MSYQRIITKAIESLEAIELSESTDKTDIENAIKMLKDYRDIKSNELINKPVLEWVKCKRKNGTEFLKLVYYSTYADGCIEAGRFNMSKHEIPNSEWTLGEILNELD